VVCATNRDLQALIVEQRFRQDLYYRISEVTIAIPPLRDRRGAAVVIAHTLLRSNAALQGRHKRGFTEEALAAIESYRWPGNVRELENKVRAAVIMANNPLITAEDLGIAAGGDADRLFNLKEARSRAERQAIHQALVVADGNVSRAAELLGVTRPTLYDLMQRYELRDEGRRDDSRTSKAPT
jgi:two-component system NtrC family response regulator